MKDSWLEQKRDDERAVEEQHRERMKRAEGLVTELTALMQRWGVHSCSFETTPNDIKMTISDF